MKVKVKSIEFTNNDILCYGDGTPVFEGERIVKIKLEIENNGMKVDGVTEMKVIEEGFKKKI